MGKNCIFRGRKIATLLLNNIANINAELLRHTYCLDLNQEIHKWRVSELLLLSLSAPPPSLSWELSPGQSQGS